MKLVTSPLQIRAIFAPPGSGATLLQRMLCENSKATGVYEHARSQIAYDRNKKPNYNTFFEMQATLAHPFLILKETLGKRLLGYKISELFPSQEALAQSKPIFIFRDPINNYASLKRKRWMGIHQFIEVFKEAHQNYLLAKQTYSDTQAFTYEKLIKNPLKTLHVICQKWGMAFEPSMMPQQGWATGLFDKIRFHPQTKQEVEVFGFKDTLISLPNIQRYPKLERPIPVLTQHEARLIETELTPLYQEIAKTEKKNMAKHQFKSA